MAPNDSADGSDAPEPRPPSGEAQAAQSYAGERDDGTLGDWLLIGVVVFSFVVAPALILLNPPALPFKFAYLVLPLLPAVLLGATAVWVALRRGSA